VRNRTDDVTDVQLVHHHHLVVQDHHLLLVMLPVIIRVKVVVVHQLEERNHQEEGGRRVLLPGKENHEEERSHQREGRNQHLQGRETSLQEDENKMMSPLHHVEQVGRRIHHKRGRIKKKKKIHHLNDHHPLELKNIRRQNVIVMRVQKVEVNHKVVMKKELLLQLKGR